MEEAKVVALNSFNFARCLYFLKLGMFFIHRTIIIIVTFFLINCEMGWDWHSIRYGLFIRGVYLSQNANLTGMSLRYDTFS